MEQEYILIHHNYIHRVQQDQSQTNHDYYASDWLLLSVCPGKVNYLRLGPGGRREAVVALSILEQGEL